MDIELNKGVDEEAPFVVIDEQSGGAGSAMMDAQAGETRTTPEREAEREKSFVRALRDWLGIGMVGVGVIASAAAPLYALFRAIKFLFGRS